MTFSMVVVILYFFSQCFLARKVRLSSSSEFNLLFIRVCLIVKVMKFLRYAFYLSVQRFFLHYLKADQGFFQECPWINTTLSKLLGILVNDVVQSLYDYSTVCTMRGFGCCMRGKTYQSGSI